MYYDLVFLNKAKKEFYYNYDDIFVVTSLIINENMYLVDFIKLNNIEEDLKLIKNSLPFQFKANHFLIFNPDNNKLVNDDNIIIFDYENNKFKFTKSEIKLENWKTKIYPLITSLKIQENNINNIEIMINNLKYIKINKDVFSNDNSKEFNNYIKKLIQKNKKYENLTNYKFLNEYNKIRFEFLLPNHQLDIKSSHYNIENNTELYEIDYLYFFSIDDELNFSEIIDNFKKVIPNQNKYLVFDNDFIFYYNESLASNFPFYLRYCTFDKNINYFSPHFGVIKKVNSENLYRVKGDYKYFHYKMENESDSGWGCAYRSLQTICSFLIYNNKNKNIGAKIPNIEKIQETLVIIGDKEDNFIGSSEWIGAFEVGYVVQKICGNEYNIIHLQNGDQIVQYYSKIKEHFENEGSPIMIGGGVKAFTILGILYAGEEEEEKSQLLILDPHYEGNIDIEKYIDSKRKTIYFKDKSFFKSNNFYNLCLINYD